MDNITPPAPKTVSVDVATIFEEMTNRMFPFLVRQLTGDPFGEIRKTRSLTMADIDSAPARRARVRYWVAPSYVRRLVAHQLYPHLFEHPGPFETPERLALIEKIYTERYGPRRDGGFAARMAGR
ncbi:hypothetical protein [Saccharothrix sp.]|uniref:hypothetical protein n=1 Tax=Saccharothrix sp. TaxID=1873460 RepID=UPI0028121FB5|nr:hypothetical protein [Saccharothrix sp.]